MQLFQHPPKHFVKLHVQISGCSLCEVKCYVSNTNTRKTHGEVALSTPRFWGGYTWGLGVTPNPEGLLDSGQLQNQGVSNTMVTPKPEELPGATSKEHIQCQRYLPHKVSEEQGKLGRVG